MKKDMPQRPPLSVKIIYALGQLGWSLTSFGAANLLVYFYFPPETGESVAFPVYIYQGALFGLIAVLGLINSGSRLFDAITDPLIANWSDKKVSAFGKRRLFMAWSALPFALFSFLIFYPISATSTTINTTWLFFTIFAFFLFMTAYVVPYTALISELGHHPDDRMLISTLISVTWALGFLIGNSAYALQSHFSQTMSATTAFQSIILAYALIGLIFMLLPVFFLAENKYCQQKPATQSPYKALASAFQNGNFTIFIFSDLLYWLALTFIQLGVGFYITVLMELDVGFASLFMGIGFLASFVLYVPINLLVKKWGKKRLMSLAFIAFSIVFGFTFAFPWLPLPKMSIFYTLAILSAFPLATFGIIPNAIIADIVHEHEAKTGEQQAAMFYGTRNFMMKMGIMLANLIFPSLLLLGKSTENPMGVQVSTLCALVFCLAGYFVFRQFKETLPKIEEAPIDHLG
ncbi:MAG: MFS transporter [Bacteroidota bacterium]